MSHEALHVQVGSSTVVRSFRSTSLLSKVIQRDDSIEAFSFVFRRSHKALVLVLITKQVDLLPVLRIELNLNRLRLQLLCRGTEIVRRDEWLGLNVEVFRFHAVRDLVIHKKLTVVFVSELLVHVLLIGICPVAIAIFTVGQ